MTDGRTAEAGGTLVIQTAFLGDVVLSTGLLTALAERYGPVDIVTTPAARPLVETHPAVSVAIGYDKRGADRGAGGFLRMARRLRRARYARAFLPHRSLRSALLALAAGIPERVGFTGGPGSWTYTRRVPRRAGLHDAERQLALVTDGRTGGRADGQTAQVSLGLTAADRAAAAAWLADRGIAGDFVALAPGSIWGTKRWGGYADLAARLPGPVVVLGGPEDAPLAVAVAAAAGARGHAAAGALSLRVSAAVIERARVLVTNDSAPLHFASAVGTPVVAIFGPTVPAFGFGPRGARGRVVEVRGLACRPCSDHGPARCPLGHHRCMREIGVDEVLEAVTGTVDG
ncbi:MAG: glycosyltransferase family 9 protein [Gemmatimonadales bacterium]